MKILYLGLILLLSFSCSNNSDGSDAPINSNGNDGDAFQSENELNVNVDDDGFEKIDFDLPFDADMFLEKDREAVNEDSDSDIFEQKLPEWILNGEKYVLNHDDGVVMEVSHTKGGRISSLRLGSSEVIVAGTELLQGSTFWISPQNRWNRDGNWPPSPEIDSESYEATLSYEKTELSLEGRVDPNTSFRIGKKFSACENYSCTDITYTINNEGDNSSMVAPWEVTRVPLGGIVFFPVESDFKGLSEFNMTETRDGIAWLTTSDIQNSGKAFRDGDEMWIAHAYGGNLFIKEYESNISPQQFANYNLPGEEAEIELYANPEGGYIEIEVQGAYAAIDSGAAIEWNVKWYVRKIPENIDVKHGNLELVEFVRSSLIELF